MEAMKDIAIYGAGGLGREVACLIRQINAQAQEWNLIGFFDDNPALKRAGISHFGTCLGGMEEMNAWEGELAVALAVGDGKIVRKLYEGIRNQNVWFPNLVHPTHVLADPETFAIGKGNIIQGGCSASCDVCIGDFNVFNGYVNLGHDAKIGSFNTLMPSAKISGGARIGDCNIFGAGSIVLQNIEVGNGVRVGAGSVLMTKPKDGCLYLGVPAMITEF